MAQQFFQFNGKNYQNLEELPEEFKFFFKDENNNGIPDIFENIQNFAQQGNPKNDFNLTQYYVNGKTYNSLDEVPLEQQQIIKDKLSQVNFAGFPKDNSPIDTTNTQGNSFNLNPNASLSPRPKDYNSLALGFLVLAVILMLLALYFG
jgi:hypothetical protein